MTIHLATGAGPITLTPRVGGDWKATRTLAARTDTAGYLFPCVAADPGQPARVYFGSPQGGVWRSDDAGANWRRVFLELPHGCISALAVSPVERVGGFGVVYVGTEPSAVFCSGDGGETWRPCGELGKLPSAGEWSFPPRPESHHVRWIEPSPHTPGHLLAAIEAGALISSLDGGQTWRDRVPDAPQDSHQLATHPHLPGKLWSAAGDGIFASDDGGKTWHDREQGLGFRYGWSVAMDPADPQTVVLAASPSALQAHGPKRTQSMLYRRTAASSAWQQLRDGLPGPEGIFAPVLATNPAEPHVFHAAINADLYRSADAGLSWQRLVVAWPPHDAGERIHALVVTTSNVGE